MSDTDKKKYDIDIRFDTHVVDKYMKEHNLTKEQFCILCDITVAEYDELANTKIDYQSEYFNNVLKKIMTKISKVLFLA